MKLSSDWLQNLDIQIIRFIFDPKAIKVCHEHVRKMWTLTRSLKTARAHNGVLGVVGQVCIISLNNGCLLRLYKAKVRNSKNTVHSTTYLFCQLMTLINIWSHLKAIFKH